MKKNKDTLSSLAIRYIKQQNITSRSTMPLHFCRPRGRKEGYSFRTDREIRDDKRMEAVGRKEENEGKIIRGRRE